jgi:hypothetical protein
LFCPGEDHGVFKALSQHSFSSNYTRVQLRETAFQNIGIPSEFRARYLRIQVWRSTATRSCLAYETVLLRGDVSFQKSQQVLSWLTHSLHFVETEGCRSHSQAPATFPYHELEQSIPYLPITVLEDPFYYCPATYA